MRPNRSSRISSSIQALDVAHISIRTGDTAQIVEFRQFGRLEAVPHVVAAIGSSPDPFRVLDASQSADRVLFDLGREALAEHADCLLLHRSRPIELPTAEI